MKNKYIEITTFLLMAATVVAGFLTTTDVALIPEEYRKYLPIAIGGIIVLKQLLYGALDLMDDGQLNKSYQTPPISKIFPALALLLLPLCLCQCVNQDSTDRELALAKAGLEAARLTYDLAAISYSARAIDPEVNPVEKIAAKRAFEAAQTRLDEASANVQAIIDRRRSAALALPTGPPEPTPVLLGERTAVK